MSKRELALMSVGLALFVYYLVWNSSFTIRSSSRSFSHHQTTETSGDISPKEDLLTSAMLAKKYEKSHAKFNNYKSWPGLEFGILKNCRPDGKSVDITINRKRLAKEYLSGSGIEVGALHNKLWVPPNVQVKYVDSVSLADQIKMYPNLVNHSLSEPDYIDSAELLSKIPKESQSFVIASHVLEHTDRTLLAIFNFLRVTKPAGILFLAVPNHCYTFDRMRVVTSWAHFESEYLDMSRVEKNRAEHFREWALSHQQSKNEPIENFTHDVAHLQKAFMDKNYSIHYHTWDEDSILEFLVNMRTRLGFRFVVKELIVQANELLFILQKI